MDVSLIAARGKNNEIGFQNKLLWDIPEDMDWFQYQTNKKPVVMGRSTYESIGRPLKGRLNIVLSRDKNYNPHPDVQVYNNIHDIFYELRNERELMIIGGDSIYRQFLGYATKLYLTDIDSEFIADAFFPEVNLDDYVRCFWQEGTQDVGFKYRFGVYKKIFR